MSRELIYAQVLGGLLASNAGFPGHEDELIERANKITDKAASRELLACLIPGAIVDASFSEMRIHLKFKNASDYMDAFRAIEAITKGAQS